MKFTTGQIVSWVYNNKKYSGTIRVLNDETYQYEITFKENPIVDNQVMDVLLVHKNSVKKIIGGSTLQNE